jgi:hypothetical protein
MQRLLVAGCLPRAQSSPTRALCAAQMAVRLVAQTSHMHVLADMQNVWLFLNREVAVIFQNFRSMRGKRMALAHYLSVL